MGTLSIVLLVLLGIVSVFLIVIVALQDEDDSGLGGVFGGSSSGSVFGSATSSVIIKVTSVLLAVFLLLSLLLAFLSKSKKDALLSYEVPAVEKSTEVEEDKVNTEEVEAIQSTNNSEDAPSVDSEN